VRSNDGVSGCVGVGWGGRSTRVDPGENLVRLSTISINVSSAPAKVGAGQRPDSPQLLASDLLRQDFTVG
jgi:hypothetical protein